MKKKAEIYTQNIVCNNCGYKTIQDFVRGFSCKGFLECPRCWRNNVKSTGPYENVKYEKNLS